MGVDSPNVSTGTIKRHFRPQWDENALLTFRGSTQFPRFSREKRALATCNGVEACTLLTQYRLARGIFFLPVGALAALVLPLWVPLGRDVSRVCHLFRLRP